MQQFNFPTTIYYGTGSLEALMNHLLEQGIKRLLIVSDANLTQLGISLELQKQLREHQIDSVLFDEVHSNPLEKDVLAGAQVYKEEYCDSILALGGGSPMDVAKVIKILSSHPEPLEQYDDAIGGAKLIKKPMPPLFAIPTTAGTGSEVGRCGVITMQKTQRKTIFFHPSLMPDIAVLEPLLTVGLPPHITAATGIDAFTHALEAWLAPDFHPMADGIALEAIKLCLENLNMAVHNGQNLKARSKMQMAATMGATAFQKGLGMIHSLAHPLSAHHKLHHGLANALVLPAALDFLENSDLNDEQKKKIRCIQELFSTKRYAQATLSLSCREWFQELGIGFDLSKYGVSKEDLPFLAKEAFADPCHATNMIAVTEEELLRVYRDAL